MITQLPLTQSSFNTNGHEKELSRQILSDLVVYTKYSKYIPELQRRETWEELVMRNQMMHMKKYPNLVVEIDNVYDLVRERKILPSMRSMQFAGKPIELSPARLYNCCFMPMDHFLCFSELMFLLLSGCGVGFSVQLHHVSKLPEIHKPHHKRRYLVGDSIEGWADAVKALIRAFIDNKPLPRFDFSDIRAKGTPLKTAGGKAPGPDPLRICLERVQAILEKKEDGEKLTSLEVHDINCHIADAVLSGGIRRSSMVSLFDVDDDDMLSSKHGEWWIGNPQRALANNSAVIIRHKIKKNDFKDLWQYMVDSNAGEPGFFFSNDKEWGLNPCFTGDTLIETPYGQKRFDELVGQEIPVYTRLDDGSVGIRIMKNIRKTRDQAEYWGVELDNGEIIRVTPDHIFFRSDMSEVSVRDLVPGESLARFSRYRANLKGYLKIGNGNNWNKMEHHIVANWKYGRWPNYPEEHVNHINENKQDNRPENLEILPAEVHNSMNMLGDKNPLRRIPGLAKEMAALRPRDGDKNPRWFDISNDELIEMGRNFESLTGNLLTANNWVKYATAKGGIPAHLRARFGGFRNFQEACAKNHKVVSVGFLGYEDVYDGEVEETHKFYLAAGVLVHNCCEISLRPYQFCNLVTINVSDVTEQGDLNNRAKAASFIATLQAGYTDFHYLREVWKITTEREALIGVSMTGIASEGILKLDLAEAANIVKEENMRVAKIIGINKAARTTCVKPEGCQVADTMVVTDHGILELGEMGNIDGDKWQEHNYSVTTDISSDKSNHFFINGTAKTKRIELSSGLSLESTLNHMYRVIDDGNYSWKKAGDISEGDNIVYRLGGYNNDKYVELNNKSYEHFCKPITSKNGKVFVKRITNFKELFYPKYLNEDFAWFLGLYFGDGSNHQKGIRITGDVREQENLQRASQIMEDIFGVKSRKWTYTHQNIDDHRCQYYWSSKPFMEFLSLNGLMKQKSYAIEIPLAIRKSPPSVINAFIEGYSAADGCGRSWVTVSPKMAKQMVVILRALGRDSKVRLMPPTESSKGTRMRYWISERKAYRKYATMHTDQREIIEQLDNLGLGDCSFDKVLSIFDSENMTYDIEVPNSNTFLANSSVSHNTTALLLGSSSGIHAWHGKFYMRRVRVLKNEAIYSYFSIYHPELLEDDVLKPERQAIISIPIQAPSGAITRSESALDLLNRVGHVWKNWVKEGHRKGDNINNVSTTVTVKDGEWDGVRDWMWDNRNDFTALAVLPYDGGSYIQAPFEEIDELTYHRMASKLSPVDFSLVKEYQDDTTLNYEVACSGNACEVV